MANRIQPYQIFYNFSINQINNILEKEIGKFFLGDINLVPSEYKDLGEDVADIWANLLDVAKSVGALTLDTSSQNTKGGVPFNQFAVYDLSQTEQLKTRMELAEWSRMKCFEMVGITPQVINGPNRYETATGSSRALQHLCYKHRYTLITSVISRNGLSIFIWPLLNNARKKERIFL